MLTNRSKQKAIESAKPNAVSALPVVVSLKRPFARRMPLHLNAAAAEAATHAAAQAREGFAAWVLLFYALWHRHHILGQAAGGDVFETLGAA